MKTPTLRAMKALPSKSNNIKKGETILDKIRHFLPGIQARIVRQGLRGEESRGFIEILTNLKKIIDKMPATYETQKVSKQDKICQLHYFRGGMDFYIVEKDKGDPRDSGADKGAQFQAYGFSNIGYGFEMGYVSIQELKENNIELDFHFEPCKFSELKNKVK